MALLTLFLFVANATPAQNAPPGSDQRFVFTERRGSTLFRVENEGDRTTSETRKCGYFLILEKPEIDPRMVKEVPEESKTTMPIFNTGAILTGVAGLAGAFGLFLGLRGTTARWLRILIAMALFSNRVMSLKAGSILCRTRGMQHSNS